MPYVTNEGAELYWEAHGQGDPVLMIMGLSFTHEMWFRVLPALSSLYRAVVFDNRGMGKSSVPRGPYSIRQMARDAYTVLRAAGYSRAHVIGASMGGMIAQELALMYPPAVRSLQLACTTHSGLFGRWPDLRCVPWKTSYWLKSYASMERERAFMKLLYAETTPLERIEEDMRVRCSCQCETKGFINQFAGILMWSAYRRLPLLRVPAMVVHGRQDRLVPVANGRAVARRIPGARFEIVENAAHIMTTDQPQICSRMMLDFLAGITGSETDERQLGKLLR